MIRSLSFYYHIKLSQSFVNGEHKRSWHTWDSNQGRLDNSQIMSKMQADICKPKYSES